MAIPELNTSAGVMLFRRLPERIFSPLASKNRLQYWSLLCRLHAKRFGQDAPVAPPYGFLVRAIIQDIEDELFLQIEWEEEDAEALGGKAIAIFNRLSESGWLRVEQRGLENMVSMTRAVVEMLDKLVEFAEEPPFFMGGKITSIDVMVQNILNAEAGGDVLNEVAHQCRGLMERVKNSSVNISDLMKTFSVEMETADYVQRFFSDFIERMFIGDYKELRTQEHPLAKRAQILRNVELMHQSESHRKRLLVWYQTKRYPNDPIRAEKLFEKDIDRLLDLRRIDEHLDRLDSELSRANKKAFSFLDYRMRSIRPVDKLIDHAVKAVLSGKQTLLIDPFAAGDLMSGERLAEPKRRVERPEPTALRKEVPSERDRAMAKVMARARGSRATPTPMLLAKYVSANRGDKAGIDSDALSIQSAADLRAFQELSMLSLLLRAGDRNARQSVKYKTIGYRLKNIGTDEVARPYVSGVPFAIEVNQSVVRAIKREVK